jgi:hypothetical protein
VVGAPCALDAMRVQISQVLGLGELVAVHSGVDGVCSMEFARTTTLTNG